jgi:adenylate kinase family enzyme
MATNVTDNPIPFVSVESAAEILSKADRILVIGCSGGGKSTLSQRLCRRFELDYISVDRDIHWLPGWVMRDKAEQRARIESFIAGDRWLMDGNGSSTFDLRMPRSDLVIWVRMPRRVAVWGILSRFVKNVGRTRPEMAPGCPERITWDFFHFVWTWEKHFAPRFIAALGRNATNTPVVMLTSRRQMRELLDLVGT